MGSDKNQSGQLQYSPGLETVDESALQSSQSTQRSSCGASEAIYYLSRRDCEDPSGDNMSI
jgi:hypothetical protein